MHGEADDAELKIFAITKCQFSNRPNCSYLQTAYCKVDVRKYFRHSIRSIFILKLGGIVQFTVN